MKKCTKCGIEKPLTEFHKLKHGRFGRYPSCKDCKKKYFLENKEKITKQRKKYYDEGKDRILAYAKQYHEENKNKINEKKKIHNSKPEVKEARKKYYEENKTKKLSRAKELRDEKKKLEPFCVYQIFCKKSNFVYIGQTTCGKIRWKQHLRQLIGGYHTNHRLQQDFSEHGEETFEWSILKEFDDKNKKTLLLEEAREIQRRINNGENLYNLVLTIEQLKMLNENKEES